MAQTVTCARCGELNPADAHFCIGCGESLSAPAATGPTVKLTGNPCPFCGVSNPENARFCVSCGRLIDVTAPQPKPKPVSQQPGYSPQPTYPRPQPRIYPRVNVPPVYVPRPQQPPYSQQWGTGGVGPAVVMGLLFLMLALFASRSGWPFFIFFLPIGLFGGMFRRHGGSIRPLAPLFWAVGLLILITSGFFWPGILFLWLLWMLFAR